MCITKKGKGENTWCQVFITDPSGFEYQMDSMLRIQGTHAKGTEFTTYAKIQRVEVTDKDGKVFVELKVVGS